VQRIECDEGTASEAEFSKQRLRGRDLVGLLGNIDMREHERGVSGECAQHLGGSAVVELVKAAAQRLAIERDAALPRCRACRLQQGGMATECRFYRGRIQPLEDVTDGRMRRRSLPGQRKDGVQPAAVDVNEGDDAAIRVAAADDGEDGEQQHVRQRVELALRPARIRNLRQDVQQRRKCRHSTLRPSCRLKGQIFAASESPLPICRRASPRTGRKPNSVQPSRQR
jgi:hypothetical protein